MHFKREKANCKKQTSIGVRYDNYQVIKKLEKSNLIKPLTILISLLFFYNSHAQYKKVVYSDENYQEINYEKFIKKINSTLFIVVNVENDTAIFKKFYC